MNSKIIRFKIIPFMFLGLLFLITCEKENGKPTDGDGNVYDTVIIGIQVWIKENLKTTKYNNGVSIPLVTDNAEWSAKTSAAYCWYNNNPDYKDGYGALYNWYTVNSKLLCPIGWHVPTEEEWTTLINNLGGEDFAGGKLKESGVTHWVAPNFGATNETGFTAIPGGARNQNDGTFYSIGYTGSWWISSSEYNENSGWRLDIQHITGGAYIKALSKKAGFSVRCIKNN